jgi:hypothetical protein
MANRILDGYSMPIGDKIEIIVDHDGPASYVGGAAGGETINASDFGLGGFEVVQADGLSSDGLNSVFVTLTGQSTSGANKANAVTSATLRWFVVSTAAEVANGVSLTGKSIRLQIRGV